MYQKFFKDTYVSKTIQNILQNTNLYKLPTVRFGDYVIAGQKYILNQDIIIPRQCGKLQKDNYTIVGVAYPQQYSANINYLPLIGDGYYDSKTHKLLGDYLRQHRDINHVDLMPFYNCFSHQTLWGKHLFMSQKTLGEENIDNYKEVGYSSIINKKQSVDIYSSNDSSVKTFLIPVKFDKDYTIAIDSAEPILMKPVLYDGEELIENYTSIGNEKYIHDFINDQYVRCEKDVIEKSPFAEAPWTVQRNKIACIFIKPGVTTIGKNIFENCSNITQVYIPSSVTEILEDAFSGCNSLLHVHYENYDGTVPVIGDGNDALSNATWDNDYKLKEELLGFQYGDVNNDGVINKKDSLVLKKYLANNDYKINLLAADTNGDGVVNNQDHYLLKYFLAVKNTQVEINLGPENPIESQLESYGNTDQSKIYVKIGDETININPNPQKKDLYVDVPIYLNTHGFRLNSFGLNIYSDKRLRLEGIKFNKQFGLWDEDYFNDNTVKMNGYDDFVSAVYFSRRPIKLFGSHELAIDLVTETVEGQEQTRAQVNYNGSTIPSFNGVVATLKFYVFPTTAPGSTLDITVESTLGSDSNIVNYLGNKMYTEFHNGSVYVLSSASPNQSFSDTDSDIIEAVSKNQKCGEKVYWNINKTVLILSGIGETYNYDEKLTDDNKEKYTHHIITDKSKYIVSASSFYQPFKINIPISNACTIGGNEYNMENLLYGYRDCLYLALQINTNNPSSIVILEGDYTDEYYSSVYDHKDTQISKLSLLQINDGQIYPFSDRLIEYLVGNVIDYTEEFPKNIQIVQSVVKDKNISGVWNKDLKSEITRYYLSNKKYKPLDNIGFVDKDIEELMFGGKW